MRRVLVTGSRDWRSYMTVASKIVEAMADITPIREGQYDYNDGDWVIVHGDCPTGADYFAEQFGRGSLYKTEPHPADWDNCVPTCKPGHRRKRWVKESQQWEEYCPSAGHRRNRVLVALGADICVAFIRNNSKGATHTADLAEKAGIPVRRYTA